MYNIIKKIPKIYIVFALIMLTLTLTVAVPTLSRFYNGINESMSLTIWDGTIASSYSSGTGTKEDPYIIVDGSEFAYFAEQLKSTDYKDTYFKLGNDIIINDGIFVYDEVLRYVSSNTEYYIKEYTTQIYNDKNYLEQSEKSINKINMIEDFKGNFDGNFFSIYGMYVTSESEDNLALFKNISGTFKNTYIENMLIYGGNNNAGLAVNSNDFKISDTYLSGLVVGKQTVVEKTSTKFNDIHTSTGLFINNLKLTDAVDNKEIISSSIKGNYLVNDANNINYNLTINGLAIELGEFKVDLGTTPINEVVISIGSEEIIRNISLINLEYEVVYNLSSSSGLITNSNNTEITNFVNNTNIYNTSSSSGLINNSTGNLKILNSYNSGTVNAEYKATGIVGNITGPTEITNVYNSGSLNAIEKYGISRRITNDNVVIKNTINSSNSEFIVENEKVILENVYNQNISNNPIVNTIDSNTLYSNESLNALNYTNFHEDPINNKWIYNDLNLPELYFIDEINLIDIRAGENYWNNTSYILENKYYNQNLNIAVTSTAPIYSLSKVEYYIKNDNIALTEEEIVNITWLSYEGPVVLDKEGQYIVYVKLTDYNQQVRYINSDVINIDKTLPSGTISFADNSWTDLRTDVSEILLKSNNNITITSNENSEENEISYLVSDEIMSEDSLNKLNEANWSEYDGTFSLTPVGENILYAKIEDKSGNIAYLNSDIITFDGYHTNYIKAGKNDMFNSDDTINITSNSSITANYIYNVPHYQIDEINHYLTFDRTVPSGTVIILTDNITGNKYDYKIENSISSSKISFKNFNLIGTVNSYFTESDYSNGTDIKENFTVTVIFENSIINDDISSYNMWITAEDNSGTIIRNTVAGSLIPFTLFKNNEASLFFNTTTTQAYLKYKSDSIATINIDTGVIYKQALGLPIYDTYIEEQDIILNISLRKEDGSSVPRSDLNNLAFKMNGNTYYPDQNGLVTINSNTGILGIDTTLEIQGYKGDSFLDIGNYIVEIDSFISYNNKQTEYIATKEVPLLVDNSTEAKNIYFKASMNNDPIIYKDTLTSIIDLNTVLTGATNPNLKISLYKKTELNALNQDYTLLNLNDYIDAPLIGTLEENKYQLLIGNQDLNLNVSIMDVQAYKIVIEAYDGEEYITTSEKHFIIK